MFLKNKPKERNENSQKIKNQSISPMNSSKKYRLFLNFLMRFSSYALFFFLVFLNFSSLTLAAPSAFVSKCGALAIQNNTTSTLLRDHENCKTVWVSPPTFGLVNISGYMANGNLGLCQEVKDVQKLSHSLTERMNSISQEIMDLSVSYKERQEEVIEAKKNVFNLENLPEIREIIDVEEKLPIMEKTIERLYSQLATCAAECSSLKEELRLKKEEKQELKDRLSTLKDHYFELALDHRFAKSELESAEYALHNIYADIDSRNNKLTALKTTLQQWLLFYSKLEGGTAHLNYDTRWTQKIATASSEGGFFSRESYNNVIEDMDDNDQFSIAWNDEDEMYSREEKDEIAKTLKGELIGRVLSSMATPIFS
ncbi:MAG: hypothetical protein KC505_10760 [Myxococcales bacterium]|nr:hypothetical protein [Myxococcales bacterium]USN50046.1 MAG: hypothetical protein H6731_07165 [Myxococcales bacterium]